MTSLTPFATNVYIKEYPISYAGCNFYSRMTVIVLSGGKILLHSPCEIDEETKAEILKLGSEVSNIVAPGNYHYFHVQSCKATFPSATVYLCPGLERKRPNLVSLQDTKIIQKDEFLDDDLEHVILTGNRIIWEVAFYHRPSKTLVLTDSIEWIGDDTPGTNWFLRVWWFLLRMWNKPKPAPEYGMGWMCKNQQEARDCMEQILKWDFDKVIIAHGENITEDAKNVVRKAWSGILG